MNDLHVPTDAPRVFQDLLGDLGLVRGTLTLHQAWRAFLEFARLPFATPDESDSDMLLYQYGIYSFSGQPRFHWNLTRQFAMEDGDEFLQFSCDLQFRPTAALEELGVGHIWWSPDDDQVVTAWVRAVEAGREWALLEGQVPLAVEIDCRET